MTRRNAVHAATACTLGLAAILTLLWGVVKAALAIPNIQGVCFVAAFLAFLAVSIWALIENLRPAPDDDDDYNAHREQAAVARRNRRA